MGIELVDFDAEGVWAFEVSAAADMDESKEEITPADKEAALNFIASMKKYVCFSCSGWGHTKTCFRKTKNKLDNKKAGGCPSNDLIDTVYKIKAIDKQKWKIFEVTHRPKADVVRKLPKMVSEKSTNDTVTYPTKKRAKLTDPNAYENFFGALPVPNLGQRQEDGQRRQDGQRQQDGQQQ